MKKKVVSILFAMLMLGGCTKTETPAEELPVAEISSVQVEEESVQEEQVEEESEQEEQVQEESEQEENSNEDDSWKEMFEYATGKIDSLREQIEVTYKAYPNTYAYVSKDNGAENGGYPSFEARSENGQLIIDSDKDVDYEECYYRLTLSDYKDDCFDKMVITKIWKDTNQEEIIEEHDNDEYMQEFRKAVLKYQDNDIQEKNNNQARTDVEQNSAKERYGLEEKERETIGNYEMISYSNESYGNKTVFMEIIQAEHIIATITDTAALRELEDYEIHEISFYNYEGGQIYQIGYEDVKEEYYETEIISRYDEYGNCLYWEDVCNVSQREYDFADVNYQYIIRQCEEILNYNNGYRQNWE